MIRIKTPATSANVGPGFDCLGIAFNLYNSFDVELSDQNILENVEDRFNNEDNLFLQAYRKGCEEIGCNDHIHAILHCDIPVSRGLGSSASMITAGITAASVLHNDAIEEGRIFQLTSEMEGHPDNAAPCIFGGMTGCLKEKDKYLAHQMDLDASWKYTLFVPDFEVSTEEARKILPDSYPRNVAAGNGAHAIMLCEALRTGNLNLLKYSAKDMIHEPYRKTLIHGFDSLKETAERDTGGILLISGSGSTCLLISRFSLTHQGREKIERMKENWKIIPAEVAIHGTEIRGDI